MLPSSVREHYRAEQRRIVATLALVRREWAKMGKDFDASWTKVGPRVALLTASAQLGAAKAGAASVPATLAEIGEATAPLGEVVPQAFAGIASDGRSLASLLYGAVIHAKTADVQTTPARLASGGEWLDMAVHTQIADAARGAAGVTIAATPGIGYVRMLNPPSCSRCALLAGRFYRWNAGFERHPRCDCRHVPATENVADDLRTDPMAYFRSLDQAEQDRIFTNAGAQAIRDGADVGRVVNARRGMSTAATPSGRRVLAPDRRGRLTTTEGTTRRGRLPGQVAGPRLMPEQIYADAENRDDAIRLLEKFGYLR